MKGALERAGFEVVAEEPDAAGAVAAAEREDPDVVLLDIHMPGNGISAAADITHSNPDVAVVMLTVSRDDSDLFDALRAGALGYLLKDTDPDRLPYALRGVLAGEAALPRALTARLIEEFRQRPGRPRAARPGIDGAPGAEYGVGLTDRELEVVELMLQDLNTIQISQRLSISAVTVRRHISAVVRKTGAHSRRAAVDVLRRRGAAISH